MRCSNCGTEQYIDEVRRLLTCRGCSKRLTACVNCDVGPYCSSCQNRMVFEGPQTEVVQICAFPACRKEILIPKVLQKKGYGYLCLIHNTNPVLTSPTPLETELKKDHKKLTTTLTLKERELKDLQAEIRALETKLSEKENNSSFQIKITKLENKLSLIKNKLKK